MALFELSATSLSATVTVRCGGDGSLSRGAIVGIAVGAILGGILIAIGVAVALKVQKARHASSFKSTELLKMSSQMRAATTDDQFNEPL